MFNLPSAIINLDKPAHYFGIGAFQISPGNAIVIVIMFILFALAIFIPFPKDEGDKE